MRTVTETNRLSPALASTALRGGLTAAIALCVLSPAFCVRADPTADTDEAGSRYRAVIEDAVREFELGQWEEAVVLFRKAHAIRPSEKTHRGLGLTLFEARDYVQAIPHLRSALRAPADTFTREQTEVLEQTLRKAQGFVGTVRVRLRPGNASVSIDGVVVPHTDGISLNPGRHTLVASASGYEPFQQKLNVEGGKSRVLRIVLSPPLTAPPAETPTAEHARAEMTPERGDRAPAGPVELADDGGSSDTLLILGWVTTGLAVAGATTAVVAWRLREDGPVLDWEQQGCQAMDDLSSGCRDAQQRADGLAAVTTVSAVAGGVLAATAITLFVVAGSDDPGTSGASLSCGAGIGAIACAGRF